MKKLFILLALTTSLYAQNTMAKWYVNVAYNNYNGPESFNEYYQCDYYKNHPPFGVIILSDCKNDSNGSVAPNVDWIFPSYDCHDNPFTSVNECPTAAELTCLLTGFMC